MIKANSGPCHRPARPARRAPGSPLSRVAVVVAGCLAGVSPFVVAPAQASGHDLCVGEAASCYHTLQAALDASSTGDVITIAPGTFTGGVTISTSLRILGAGPGRTVIRGGGPVVTITAPTGGARPNVTISGLTITGGLTRGSGAVAEGGGIYVPPSDQGSPGATVALDHVVVTRNRVIVSSTISSQNVTCPGGPCPFAISRGGGIATYGTMSMAHTTVSHNRAAGLASDAIGGGIFSSTGHLSLDDTRVARNHAVASIPNGRFAEGGGLFVESGSVRIDHSLIRGNRASLHSRLPSTGDAFIELAANGGGAHVSDGVAATFIAHTAITHNVADAADLNGEPLAYDSGLLVGGGNLVMRHSIVSRNTARATAGTSVDVGGGGSALEVNGAATITDTRITDNPSIVRSPHGVAQVSSGLAVLNFDGNPRLVVVRRSVIARNTARALSKTGTAKVFGAGVLNNSLLKLDRVAVRDNVGHVRGTDATAQGGGIWNGVLYSGPPVKLTLRKSRITGNSLSGSVGADLRGGGLFTTTPVRLLKTRIVANSPDQCFGCLAGRGA